MVVVNNNSVPRQYFQEPHFKKIKNSSSGEQQLFMGGVHPSRGGGGEQQRGSYGIGCTTNPVVVVHNNFLKGGGLK